MAKQREAARVGSTGGGLRSAAANRLHSQSTPGRHGRQGVPIHTAAGKVVGSVASGVFGKRIHSQRGHLLRTPPSLCFDLESLTEAENAGAEVIRVVDGDTGRVYAATMGDVRRGGFLINRRYGDQLAVPLSLWTVTGGDPAGAVQLGLFAGGKP